MESSFYTTAKLEVQTDGSCSAVLEIDPAHPIFKGHFPGMPVLPGVCMIGMVRKTLERQYASPLRMAEARSIKFLNLLNPNDNHTVLLSLKTRTEAEGSIGVDGILTDLSGAFVFFKITANYVPGQ